MGANGERVTRSESVIVTERREGQGAGQEKGSGVRTELPFWNALSRSPKRWWRIFDGK